MKDKNLREKLDRLIEDPVTGAVKKGQNSILTDLRSRLENIEKIYKKTRTDEIPLERSSLFNTSRFEPASVFKRERELDIQSLASVGQRIEGEGEGFILWENSFALDHSHGELLLNSIKRLNPGSFAVLNNIFLKKEFNPESALFIDTETTGLAGGTGTLAFLIGMGFFDQNSFKVRQYFMRDYSEEAAALNSITKFAAKFEHIVTFNGKGFDIPLLQARMILNRIKFDFSSFSHIDLLYPARMIFKHRLEDCRLSSIERFVIRFFREDDIPSEEIPHLYFRYLRSRNPALMDKVFYHNAMDIVSLAVLTTRIAELMEKDTANFEFGEDIFGVGHFYFSTADYKNAEFFFRKSFEHPLPYNLRHKLLTELSIILKRTGRIDEASEIWLGMIEGQKGFTIFPYIELAKYHEHHKKAYGLAVEIVTKAVNRMQEAKAEISSRNYSEFQKELLYRLKRLERKAKTLSW
jgi:uncharacterized protein YprB with RNaseH-like and TPR domain